MRSVEDRLVLHLLLLAQQDHGEDEIKVFVTTATHRTVLAGLLGCPSLLQHVDCPHPLTIATLWSLSSEFVSFPVKCQSSPQNQGLGLCFQSQTTSNL